MKLSLQNPKGCRLRGREAGGSGRSGPGGSSSVWKRSSCSSLCCSAARSPAAARCNLFSPAPCSCHSESCFKKHGYIPTARTLGSSTTGNSEHRLGSKSLCPNTTQRLRALSPGLRNQPASDNQLWPVPRLLHASQLANKPVTAPSKGSGRAGMQAGFLQIF